MPDPRLRGLSPEVLDPNGEPRVFYRGTQTAQALRGVRGVTSWTDSLTIALIWSAVPGDVWASRKTSFIETSTVHAAHLALRNPLVFKHNGASVGDIMRALRYGEPNGLTDEELRRVWNYLHNRLYGKAKGGEFNYVAYDEEGDELGSDEEPFSIQGNVSHFTELRDEQEYAEGEQLFAIGDQIAADAYVYFDSKRVQEAARRLGFDGLIYMDIFEGCQYAAEELFDPREVDCELIEGIEIDQDVKYDDVPTHWTYRPLYEDRVIPLWSEPAEELAAKGQEREGVVAEGARRGEVIRPVGWNAANDVPDSWTRPGHLYRGITEGEFRFIETHDVIRSTEQWSAPGEGTNFAEDAGDAESYVNFGRTDPRETGTPTYLIEVKRDARFKRWPDGYWKALEVPASLITRVWEMIGEEGAVVAYELLESREPHNTVHETTERGPFDRYRALPADPDRGSPRAAYGPPSYHLVGDYWTVPVVVPLEDLSSLRATAIDKARLRSVQRAREEGVKLPPIEIGVFQNGSGWIVDGNHRLVAARRAKDDSVEVVFTFIPTSGGSVEAQHAQGR
jgi:hypothetical protein